MQILIGCAKTMTDNTPTVSGCTLPVFQANADEIASKLANYTPEELAGMLRCNMSIAKTNWLRYQHFDIPQTRRPAVFSYDGMVFQKISALTLTDADLRYANDHLMIASFLYGLLRPLDLINPYRLEGNIELPDLNSNTIFEYWKPILTDWFIDKVKADDGVLINLASNEFRDIFDWKRVKSELTVITPEFKVDRDNKLKTIVIYAKMCRGAMTRWLITNRINDYQQLKAFEYEGFTFFKDNTFVLR